MCYITMKTMANDTGHRVIKGEQKIVICDCLETAKDLITDRKAERERQGYMTLITLDRTESIYNEPLQVKDVEIAYVFQAISKTTIEQYRVIVEWDDLDDGEWNYYRDDWSD